MPVGSVGHDMVTAPTMTQNHSMSCKELRFRCDRIFGAGIFAVFAAEPLG
jgi:hypothetical protein